MTRHGLAAHITRKGGFGRVGHHTLTLRAEPSAKLPAHLHEHPVAHVVGCDRSVHVDGLERVGVEVAEPTPYRHGLGEEGEEDSTINRSTFILVLPRRQYVCVCV